MLARKRTVAILRIAAVTGGAGVFAMLPPETPPHRGLLFVAFFLTFLIGANWRLVRGVMLRDHQTPAPATWAGGAAAASCFALAVALAAAGTVGTMQALQILAAHGVALNAAYIPAKRACMGAGCCARAAAPDLRLVEIAVACALALAALACLAAAHVALAACIGLGGHLALRLHSYRERGFLAGMPRALVTDMQDLAPLAAATLAAAFAALRA